MNKEIIKALYTKIFSVSCLCLLALQVTTSHEMKTPPFLCIKKRPMLFSLRGAATVPSQLIRNKHQHYHLWSTPWFLFSPSFEKRYLSLMLILWSSGIHLYLAEKFKELMNSLDASLKCTWCCLMTWKCNMNKKLNIFIQHIKLM